MPDHEELPPPEVTPESSESMLIELLKVAPKDRPADWQPRAKRAFEAYLRRAGRVKHLGHWVAKLGPDVTAEPLALGWSSIAETSLADLMQDIRKTAIGAQAALGLARALLEARELKGGATVLALGLRGAAAKTPPNKSCRQVLEAGGAGSLHDLLRTAGPSEPTALARACDAILEYAEALAAHGPPLAGPTVQEAARLGRDLAANSAIDGDVAQALRERLARMDAAPASPAADVRPRDPKPKPKGPKTPAVHGAPTQVLAAESPVPQHPPDGAPVADAGPGPTLLRQGDALTSAIAPVPASTREAAPDVAAAIAALRAAAAWLEELQAARVDLELLRKQVDGLAHGKELADKALADERREHGGLRERHDATLALVETLRVERDGAVATRTSTEAEQATLHRTIDQLRADNSRIITELPAQRLAEFRGRLEGKLRQALPDLQKIESDGVPSGLPRLLLDRLQRVVTILRAEGVLHD